MTKRDLPSPIYAVAGAGDLAYQRLRKLPDTAARTLRNAGQTAADLRRRFADGQTLDLTRVRESAQRNAAAATARVSAASRKAVAGYRRLVAHGERVLAERGRSATLTATPPAELVSAPAAADGDTPPAATDDGAEKPAGGE